MNENKKISSDAEEQKKQKERLKKMKYGKRPNRPKPRVKSGIGSGDRPNEQKVMCARERYKRKKRITKYKPNSGKALQLKF